MDDINQKAIDRALRALGQRAHSEQEIVDKLTRSGFDERTIAQTMAKLAQYKLTDDDAFAEQWARSRVRRGMGPYRIAQELRHKGVDAGTIQEAVGAIDQDDAMERAVALATKHLRRGDERARKRAYDALVRRGYDFDMARSALSVAAEQLALEDDDDPFLS